LTCDIQDDAIKFVCKAQIAVIEEYFAIMERAKRKENLQ